MIRSMQLSDYDYKLPENLIASHPAKDRTRARLLQVKRDGACNGSFLFKDIIQFFKSGDVLVLNNTKVLPARLLGVRSTGGKVEAMLLKEIRSGRWEALMKPSGRIKKGAVIHFLNNGSRLTLKVLDEPRLQSGARLVEFDEPDLLSQLEKVGHMPLPPYIPRADTRADREDYQTVYATQPGAIAAPTAGLHFDEGLLAELKRKGVEIVFVTLHVSYGTFQPVQFENPKDHEMFEESYAVSQAAAETINAAKKRGARIIACGTTSVRTLESAARDNGTVRAGGGTTKLFIYPPYSFKIVNGLITNFHLPKSTLMMLVSAFLEEPQKLTDVYKQAIQENFRFYSYGDAMVIVE